MSSKSASGAQALNNLDIAVGISAEGRWPLPWLAGPLQAALALGKAHAVLVHGPAGGGQLELALLLAQAWLCESNQGAAPPCGRCASCHQVRQRSHTDLRLLLPEALRAQYGWLAEDDTRTAKADAKPSRDLKVGQVRDAISWGQQTSGRGRGKVLVLHPADALNTIAANALLKTLEEPPGLLRIVLTSTDPERLLPTVRSRCQRLPLPLPAPDQAQAWLAEQGVADAGVWLALAGGSPLEARAWAAEGQGAAALAELPRRVAAGDVAALAGRPVPRALALLGKLAHDALVVSMGGQARYFPPRSIPTGADPAALLAWHKALLRAARFAEHPWNGPLLIESLVSQASSAWTTGAGAAAGPGGAARSRRPA